MLSRCRLVRLLPVSLPADVGQKTSISCPPEAESLPSAAFALGVLLIHHRVDASFVLQLLYSQEDKLLEVFFQTAGVQPCRPLVQLIGLRATLYVIVVISNRQAHGIGDHAEASSQDQQCHAHVLAVHILCGSRLLRVLGVELSFAVCMQLVVAE